MSDIEKAIFKAKLELEIITAEEIQRWAIETVKKDSSNDLALEICFLSTPEQVTTYFNQLSRSLFNTDLTKESVNKLLKDYIEKHLELVKSQELLFPFLQKLLALSKAVENEDLFELLNYYDDQFYLSFEGYTPSEPDAVFKEFITDLKDFLSTQS
ncbi:hypothetical protein [Acinetobacter courvalinii]|uniref:Uncharacterized protein n=1 Tax=Acinetobacter courvalinii TaxID=280147 RepID=A0AA42LCX4_9GAMM|nr:hypothetical protein [Acinetobacter courvalinii]MCU4370007.1 hypothetical protein [Acinetobacter courvalinii]MCU4448212.1 hypothetical protein [Acinetobacter courvalinii]MDH0565586.1 hypothetical protein [Acinetobacter courvalinii]